jgi:hypothetical protein
VNTGDMAVMAVGVTLGAALTACPLAWWLARGRDPTYTDDESVLMPEPPAGLTPGLASIVLQGEASRNTVIVGLMDLASRGLIRLVEEPSPVLRRAGFVVTPKRHRVKLLRPPEDALYQGIHDVAGRTGVVSAALLGSCSDSFAAYSKALETIAGERGWLTSPPTVLIRRWRILAVVELLAGAFGAGWLSAIEDSQGISPWPAVATGAALLVAGVVTFVSSGAMPSRSEEGARIRAWLLAYRRTLKATIAQSRSLGEVVDRRPLPWVTTPEDHVTWAVAFGLEREIDRVLSTSLSLALADGWPRTMKEWLSLW